MSREQPESSAQFKKAKVTSREQEEKEVTSPVEAVSLLVTDEREPTIKLTRDRQNAPLKVTTVVLRDPITMKPVASAARLCGGSDTCLALVETLPSGRTPRPPSPEPAPPKPKPEPPDPSRSSSLFSRST